MKSIAVGWFTLVTQSNVYIVTMKSQPKIRVTGVTLMCFAVLPVLVLLYSMISTDTPLLQQTMRWVLTRLFRESAPRRQRKGAARWSDSISRGPRPPRAWTTRTACTGASRGWRAAHACRPRRCCGTEAVADRWTPCTRPSTLRPRVGSSMYNYPYG